MPNTCLSSHKQIVEADSALRNLPIACTERMWVKSKHNLCIPHHTHITHKAAGMEKA